MRAAQGYFELGMFEEAAGEIEAIQPENRSLPDVAAFLYTIYAAMKKWVEAEVAARHMVELNPGDSSGWIHWAYATRRCRTLADARKILLKAEVSHPHDATIQFNLGCYACQMGDLAEAKSRVDHAIALAGKFRWAALNDPDLKPLWGEIGK